MAGTPDLENYVSGGYYVVKRIPKPKGVSDILPAQLLTISNCFTTVIEHIVKLKWDAYEDVREAISEEASAFNIPEQEIPSLVRWVKSQQNTNYLVYTDVQSPLELLVDFITDTSAHVIGIGLHTGMLASFQSQLSKDVNNGLGLEEVVKEQKPLAPGGFPVGYEPLGFEATKFHSWLCHYTPDEAFKRFGIRPNQLGLINTFDEARQVTEYLLQTGAEPAIWEPWLLVDYSSHGTSKRTQSKELSSS